GVDHHIAGAVWSDLLPSRDLIGRVEAGPRRKTKRGFGIVKSNAVQDHEADAFRQVAKLLGFRPSRYEEIAAPRLDQRLGRLARAEPVGLGLDRRTRRNAGIILKPAPVRLDG